MATIDARDRFMSRAVGTAPPVDPPGGGGDDGGMDTRVSKLEALAEKTGERLHAIDLRLTKIETKMDQFATKEEMHKEFGSLTWKLVVAIVLAQLIPAIPGILRALKLVQ